jgi:hypothetical protein
MKLITHYNTVSFNPKPAERSWGCVTNDVEPISLGTVAWYLPWRVYCFFPSQGSILGIVCMAEIMHFLHQLNERVELNGKEPDFFTQRETVPRDITVLQKLSKKS